MKVGVYISHLNKIGGVETFAINLCNRTGFDLIFNTASLSALKKVNYKAVSLDFADTDYDVLIIGTAWGKSPDRIKARINIQVVHADYKAYIEGWNFIYKRLPYITHHVAVGHHVAKQFQAVTGYKADRVIHNLLDSPQSVKKAKIPASPLKLVTLSRISKEKGFFRMIEMAEKINVPFCWDVYGDFSTMFAKSIIPLMGKFRLMGITDRPKEIIGQYHYLVQLSDTEGFPYSVYESLQCLTPVISTDYPSVHELIKDGDNGYILDMELSNFDIKKILNVPKITKFKEKSSTDDWFSFINKIYY
jgi:glycosyltransferase involved in cell wall biosynthesis